MLYVITFKTTLRKQCLIEVMHIKKKLTILPKKKTTYGKAA